MFSSIHFWVTIFKVGALTCLLLAITTSCNRQDTSLKKPENTPAIEQPSPQEAEPTKQASLQPTEQESVTLDDQLAAVRQLQAAGNAAAAWEMVQGLLVTHPQHTHVLFLAAGIKADQEEWEVAAKILQAISPTDPEAGLASLGQAADWYQKAGKWLAAKERFLELLKHYPDVALAHRRLVYICNHQGDRFEAAVHLQRLCELGDVTQYELCSMISISEPFHTSDAVTAAQTEANRFLLAHAREHLSKGDLVQASQSLSIVERDFPDVPSIAAFRGRLLAESQDVQEIARWIQTLPKETDQYPEYWLALGSWFELERKTEASIHCYGQAVLKDPTFRDGYRALLRALSTLGTNVVTDGIVARLKVLDELHGLVVKVGADGRDVDLIERIAKLLEQLQRPWEAICWRVLAAQYRGDLQERSAEFVAQRKSLMASSPNRPPAPFLLCGLDLEKFPSPNLDDLPKTTQPPSTPAEFLVDSQRISFTEITQPIGLDFRFVSGANPPDQNLLIHETLGGGVAVLDYDLDGWSDLYFAQAGGKPNDRSEALPNQLFRNIDGGSVLNVTRAAGVGDLGYGLCVSVADINQDGFSDLLIGNHGSNTLLINRGDGTFADQSAVAGFKQRQDFTTAIAAADLDRDGLPDLVEINYVDDPTSLTRLCEGRNCAPTQFKPAADRFHKSLGDGTFVPLAVGLGDEPTNAYGLGLIIADIDAQGGNDLFVANDMTANHYWVQQHKQSETSFVNAAVLKGCAFGPRSVANACMGVAFADFDQNGLPDLFVTNFYKEPNNYFQQQETGAFFEAAASSGLYEISFNQLGFGTQAIDLDNNQVPDLLVLNGHVDNFLERGIPHKMNPQAILSNGKKMTLLDPAFAGDFFREETLGRCLVTCDFDRDGGVDFVATHLDRGAAVVRNTSRGENWLQLDLVGVSGERDAIGTTVIVTANGRRTVHSVATGNGYLGRNESTLCIGLGNASFAEQLEILWPGGEKQMHLRVAANCRYLIAESRSDPIQRAQ